MKVQRYLWFVTVILTGALAGCLGGSGSSGFDPTENAAIEQVIDTQECQEFEGLVICPADSGIETKATATPTPTITPLLATPTQPTPPVSDTPTRPNETPAQMTPLPTFSTPTATRTNTPGSQGTETIPTPIIPPPMEIETNVGTSNDINCAGATSCSFTFFFVAIGFPADAIYRTAFREGDDQPWSISEPTDIVSEPTRASFADQVVLEPRANAPAGAEPTVQFAVLVFLDDPGALPGSVSLLGETGADFAYVLPAVPVSQ